MEQVHPRNTDTRTNIGGAGARTEENTGTAKTGNAREEDGMSILMEELVVDTQTIMEEDGG
eukprot:7895862-Heterocapsa_arctica.AAC.1